MQNPSPQDILSGSQTGDNAAIQPCYSPSGTQVNWITQNGSYRHTILSPTGYQFPTTTVFRQGNTIGPIRLYHPSQNIYQQSMAPTPPGHIPINPTDIYSPPPTNPLPTITQFQSYPQTQGTYQQLQQTQQQHQNLNQQASSYQQTLNQNTNNQPQNTFPYVSNHNNGSGNVRQQLVHHLANRQQYIITPNLPQLTPPPSARPTPRGNQRTQRNNCLSALLTTTGSSNVDPQDQTRNITSIPYTPKHPKFLSIDISEQIHNSLIDLPPTNSFTSCPINQDLVPPLTSSSNQCEQCSTGPPSTTVPSSTSSSIIQSHALPPVSIAQPPNALLPRLPPSIIRHGRSSNSVAQTQASSLQPAVSVSSTTRITTMPSTSNAHIQVKPETANKACQFVSNSESVKFKAQTREIDCQTEDSAADDQSNKKTFVDRASSPINFPSNIQVRRKITAKRKLIREQTPSPPQALDVTNGQTSSDSEIDVIE